MAEKTEKATPKKLRDARRKGQVAKSQDFPSAITFIVSISTALGMAGYIFEKIGGFMIEMLKQVAHNEDFEDKAGDALPENTIAEGIQHALKAPSEKPEVVVVAGSFFIMEEAKNFILPA